MLRLMAEFPCCHGRAYLAVDETTTRETYSRTCPGCRAKWSALRQQTNLEANGRTDVVTWVRLRETVVTRAVVAS